MKNLLKFLVLAVFLKQLAWMTFVPIWQTPDEQAHFAQVTVVAETNSIHIPAKNLSQEIFKSEKVLGVLRDDLGNNKYTYHPEFNLPYSNDSKGFFENSITRASIKDRQTFVASEATDYPWLYYKLSAFFYDSVYDSSLLDRVFAVRIFGGLALVAMTWVAYKIGELLFENSYEAMLFATLVGFMPMLTFVHSGVSSDTLFNLLFSLVIWQSLALIKTGLTIRNLISIGLITILAFWTKPQANITAFILIPLVIYLIIVTKKSRARSLIFGLGVCGLAFFGIAYRLYYGAPLIPETENLKNLNLTFPTILEHLKFTANHTYREVLPWFWGVFRWLSLGLPDSLRKTTSYLTVLSFAGFSVYVLKKIYAKNHSRQFSMYMFLAFACAVYFAAITAFDFGFRQSHGYSFGIQGRYFFPIIIPFMGLFQLGLKALFPDKYQNIIQIVLAMAMVVFNLLTFGWLTSSYYQTGFPKFFIQASQYKPIWLKYPINEAILIAYLVSSILLTMLLIFSRSKRLVQLFNDQP